MSEKIQVTTDPNLDILSLVQSNVKSNPDVEKTEEPIKSPLDLARESKQKGMIVENDSLREEKVSGSVITEEREKEFQRSLDEMDELIEKAKYVQMDKSKITSDVERAQAIDALSSIPLEDLKAAAESGNTENQNIDILGDEITQDTAKSIGIQKNDVSSKYFEVKKYTRVNPEDGTYMPDEDPSDEEEEVDPEKEKMIQVIIDKTGLGIDLNFTEEEKKKIQAATTIHITEVEELDLKSIRIERSERSFLDSINDEEYALDFALTPMTFPASRFKAQMAGFTFGELGDISAAFESTEYDVQRKKYHIIYEKMKNPSIGAFKDFEDFLNNFAFVDAELAVYGSYISTNPEEDSLQLRCNKEGCKKYFERKFRPRGLIDLKHASKKFLETMEMTAKANGIEAVRLHKDSPILKSKVIELPNSKYLCELGIMSCKDHLEKIVNPDVLKNFQESHPEDVSKVKQIGIVMLTAVKSFFVPNSREHMKYRKYDNVEDILEICYLLPPEDFAILLNFVGKINEDYDVRFGIDGVECPYCGTKTDFVDVPISSQVFQRYQALMSTSLDLKDMQGI